MIGALAPDGLAAEPGRRRRDRHGGLPRLRRAGPGPRAARAARRARGHGRPRRPQGRGGPRGARPRRAWPTATCRPTRPTSTRSSGPGPSSRRGCGRSAPARGRPWRPPSARRSPPSPPRMPGAGSASPATRPRTDPQSALVLQPRFDRSARKEGPGMTDVSEAEGWARGLDELADRLAPRFGRVEPRRRALAYLRGLLAPRGAQERLAAGRGGGRPRAGRDAGLPLAACAGMPTRSGTTCGPTWSSSSATPARCWCWTRPGS